MRLPAVSVALVALLSLSLAFADATPRRAKRHTGHFIVPLLLRGDAASGRSGNADTGRGLMAKLATFKSIFQQPQSNYIIIRPTTLTSPTTATTTRLARGNVDTGRRDDGDGDAAPTGQPLLDEVDDAYEDMPPVVLGTNGVDNKLAVQHAAAGRRGVRRSHNGGKKKWLHGQQHISSYNRPVALRSASDDNSNNYNKGADHDRNNRHALADDGYRQRHGNRRRRKHKIIRNENGGQANVNTVAGSSNNNDSGDGVSVISMDPNVIGNGAAGIGSNNNNNNNHNNGLFELNANTLIQSIMNAFRRQQTPTIHNH